jgi:hypothetical protein
MNKQQLFTASSVLLASTALATVAFGATPKGVGHFTFPGPISTGATTFSSSPITVAATVFGGSTATNAIGTAATVPASYLLFANQYPGSAKLNISLTIAGASFVNTGTVVNLLVAEPTGHTASTFVVIPAQGNCASVIPLPNSMLISGCVAAGTLSGVSAGIAGIEISGVTFNNAAGLATAGTSITLAATVTDNATNTQLETVAAGNLITSANPIQAKVTAGPGRVANPNTTPTAFTALNDTGATGGDTLTVTLASINLSITATVGANLTTPLTLATAVASANVTVQSAVLSSAASGVIVLPIANATSLGTNNTVTTAAFSSGTLTFSVAAANLPTSFIVNVTFSGTTAIPAAAAGTATVSFAATGGGVTTTAAAGATGNTASISQGGFHSEVNTFFSSAVSGFQSFIRIHNNGSIPGAVTVTVKSDDSLAGGGTVGTPFSTSVILPNGTLQLGASDIEGSTTSTKLPAGGANIPAASRTGYYTVQVTGPIIGYVQHMLYNPTTQQFGDVSSFRNGGSDGATGTAP